MKVLLDQNLSEHLKPLLTDHTVTSARDRRWDRWDLLKNGDLLRAAEAERFDVLLTADKKMFHQQSHKTRVIALVVLSTNRWQILRQAVPAISAAIFRAKSGSYELVQLEPDTKTAPAKAIE